MLDQLQNDTQSAASYNDKNHQDQQNVLQSEVVPIFTHMVSDWQMELYLEKAGTDQVAAVSTPYLRLSPLMWQILPTSGQTPKNPDIPG